MAWVDCAAYGATCAFTGPGDVRIYAVSDGADGGSHGYGIAGFSAAGSVSCVTGNFTVGWPANQQLGCFFEAASAPASAASAPPGTMVLALQDITPDEAGAAWFWGFSTVIVLYSIAWGCGQVFRVLDWGGGGRR